MSAFWIALQFLTIFPVQLKSVPSPLQNARALLFYPVIGLLIGGILYAVVLLFHALPAVLLATICLILWVWLTGGLHLDGLADTADAWVGGFGDKDRTLSIMKDPSCGPIGVLSLIVLCLLKWSCLYVLIDENLHIYLLMFPVLGRLAPLYLFLTTTYVRSHGLGTQMAQYLPRPLAWGMLFISLLICLLGGIKAALAMVFASAVLWYLRRKFIQRIGGITGDTIGASIEMVEAVSLSSLVICSFYL